MSLCVSTCASDTPLLWEQACDMQFRNSGIDFGIFFRCDWQFNGTVTINNEALSIGPVTSLDAWRTGIANRYIVKTPDLIGSKDASSFTTARIRSCLPEAITGETHTVSLISKNTDPDNLTDCTFWSTIKTDYLKYKFAWVGCDGLYYGADDTNEPFFDWVPVSPFGWVIADDSEVPQEYQATVSFNLLGDVCPTSIPGLKDIFSIDVNT